MRHVPLLHCGWVLRSALCELRHMRLHASLCESGDYSTSRTTVRPSLFTDRLAMPQREAVRLHRLGRVPGPRGRRGGVHAQGDQLVWDGGDVRPAAGARARSHEPSARLRHGALQRGARAAVGLVCLGREQEPAHVWWRRPPSEPSVASLALPTRAARARERGGRAWAAHSARSASAERGRPQQSALVRRQGDRESSYRGLGAPRLAVLRRVECHRGRSLQ